MKIKTVFLAAGLLAATMAQASINIPTVLVGNANNANDTTGYGGVSYDYHIGTHAVTNAQYTSFLNSVAASDPHGLWNGSMGSSVHGGISRSGSDGSYTYSIRTADSGFNDGKSMANMPVNFISFWSAARFTNWLTTGNTETGVYVLTEAGITNNTVTRDATAWANGGVAIASEDEWYKAAYYDGAGSYWLYPTQSNTAPTAENPPGGANSANYSGFPPGTVTEVGAYADSASYYGTFDQGGNVFEWNDAIVSTTNRGQRGGSFYFAFGLDSSNRESVVPAGENMNSGFRVTSLAPIPEPSTYAAIFGLLTLGFVLWRRKGRGAR